MIVTQDSTILEHTLSLWDLSTGSATHQLPSRQLCRHSIQSSSRGSLSGAAVVRCQGHQDKTCFSPELQESDFILGSVSSLIVPIQATRPINLYV